MKSIVFTGGGSAGHVVPNIALINAFLAQNITVSYIGSEDGIEKTLITNSFSTDAGSDSVVQGTERSSSLPPCGGGLGRGVDVPYYSIATGKLRRYFSLKNFLDPFKVLLGIYQAFSYLGKIKPDVVFSKGGFVAFPVVFSAWLRGIPVIAHESDLTPGLANRLSFPFVKKIALTFAPLPHSPLQGKKTVVTGTPIREDLFHGDAAKGRALCEFNNKKPCVMIIGGGSGSAIINNTIRQILPELLKTMNVIHCCGKGKIDLAFSRENVHKNNELHDDLYTNYKQFEYVDSEMADLYACSDLIISRAGANTVYEILALHKVAIFIPLSLKASRGDQIANANFLKAKGLCEVLDESALTPESLMQFIQKTETEQAIIQEKIIQYGVKSGTEAIVNLINQITKEV